MSDTAREARQILVKMERKRSNAEKARIKIKTDYEVLSPKKLDATNNIEKWKEAAKNILNCGDVFLLNPRTVHSFEMSKNAKFVRTFCLTIAGINLK